MRTLRLMVEGAQSSPCFAQPVTTLIVIVQPVAVPHVNACGAGCACSVLPQARSCSCLPAATRATQKGAAWPRSSWRNSRLVLHPLETAPTSASSPSSLQLRASADSSVGWVVLPCTGLGTLFGGMPPLGCLLLFDCTLLFSSFNFSQNLSGSAAFKQCHCWHYFKVSRVLQKPSTS